MDDIETAAGTKVYIGPVTSGDTLAVLDAATPYVEIGLVESVGEIGDQPSDVGYAAIGYNRVHHDKGAPDGGVFTFTCAHDPTDVGQNALKAAMVLQSNNAFKIVLPDFSFLLFLILVMSIKSNRSESDQIIRRTYTCAVQSEIFAQDAPPLEAEEILQRDGQFITDRDGEQVLTRGF